MSQTLKQRLTDDMKTALKARESLRLNTIRFVISQVRNYEIDHGEQDDAGVEQIIVTQVKQIKESLEAYRAGDRAELAAEEEQKLAVLADYLPQPLTESELKAIVDEVVAATDSPTMGAVIAQVRAKVGNRANGGMIAQLVKQALA